MKSNCVFEMQTQYRDADTIDRFLNAFVDRAASEDRRDEESMMEPLLSTRHGTGFDAFEGLEGEDKPSPLPWTKRFQPMPPSM